MSELDYFNAVLLGFIQGLTEFLPISSSAHLALTQRWMGLSPNSPTMLLFDVIVHFATLIAVGYVFARPMMKFLNRLKRESSSSWSGKRFAWPVAWCVILASIPTAIIGLTFKQPLEQSFDDPVWIGIGLLITGVLLMLWRIVGTGTRGWRSFRWWQAIFVGIAQGCAISPGISRSGATICMASYCGLRHRWAAQFSFLIAMPAIVGGVMIKLRDTFALSSDVLSDIAWGPVILGSVVSLVVGVIALRILLQMIRRAKLHYFSFYCWIVGLYIVFNY